MVSRSDVLVIKELDSITDYQSCILLTSEVRATDVVRASDKSIVSRLVIVQRPKEKEQP